MDQDGKDPLADEQRARARWRGDDEGAKAPGNPGHTQPVSESDGDDVASGGGSVPAPPAMPPD